MLDGTVGSAKDREKIYNFEMKYQVINNEKSSSIVNPRRDDILNKRRYKSAQVENAKKMSYTQSSTIVNLSSLCESFPNISSDWKILYFEHFIKLRHSLNSENNFIQFFKKYQFMKIVKQKYVLCICWLPNKILWKTRQMAKYNSQNK